MFDLARLIFQILVLCVFFSLKGMAQSPPFPLDADKLAYAKEVEHDAIQKKDSLLLAEAYYLYGKLHAIAGDNATSKSYFLKSLRILEPRGDSYNLGRLYVRLSENMKNSEDIRYANLAYAVFKRIKSERGLMLSYNSLGQIYRNRSITAKSTMYLDSALIYLKKAMHLSYQLKDTVAVAEASLKLGELYTDHDNPEAIPTLEKAVKLFPANKNNRAQISARIFLGVAYLNAGEFKKCYATLLNAQRRYAENTLPDLQLSIWLDQAFIKYYERTGQWKQALERFKHMYDSDHRQFETEKDGEVLRLQIEYETSKKEIQLNSQNQDLQLKNKLLKSQQNIIILTILLLTVATALSILFFKQYRKNQRTSIKNEQLVREQNHRVKNNLQVVSSLLNMQARLLSDPTAKRAVEESLLRVQSMAIVHRKLYDRSGLEDIELQDFIPELAEGVLSACGYPAIKRHYSIDPIWLDIDKSIPLGLILNELITNACKYAFPDIPDPVLTITCQQVGNQITLQVADNGPGISNGNKIRESDSTPGQLTRKRKSFGLELIDIQVHQLYGTYNFTSSEGTKFSMKFRQ